MIPTWSPTRARLTRGLIRTMESAMARVSESETCWVDSSMSTKWLLEAESRGFPCPSPTRPIVVTNRFVSLTLLTCVPQPAWKLRHRMRTVPPPRVKVLGCPRAAETTRRLAHAESRSVLPRPSVDQEPDHH